MKPIRKLIFISSALLVTIPAICSAASYGRPYTDRQTGPYASGFIGVNIPRDRTVTSDDFSPPASSFQDRVEFDPGLNIGGTGGYDFGLVRLEGELSYKHSEIKSITDQNNSNFRNPDGNLGVLAFMANAFFDLHNDTLVTPYLGGGIGFATLRLSDTYGTGATGRLRLYDEGDDTVFAYQVGGGVDIAINRRFSLDIGYRYFGTDNATFNKNSNLVTSMKFESHNTSVGFRVRF